MRSQITNTDFISVVISIYYIMNRRLSQRSAATTTAGVQTVAWRARRHPMESVETMTRTAMRLLPQAIRLSDERSETRESAPTARGSCLGTLMYT